MKAQRSEPKFSSKIQKIKSQKHKNTKTKKNIKRITKQNKKLFYSFIIWGKTLVYLFDIYQKI